MAFEIQQAIFTTSKRGQTVASIIARQDRIPVWALPKLFIGIIGLGYLFTFFDIYDINVSFIQTCIQIVHSCTPLTASKYIGPPVLLNLAGYVIGTLILSPLADRYGRRDMLVVTMVITGLGSLLTALMTNYSGFIIGRTITGIGLGAELSIVNTYVNELAPTTERAKYASLIFIMSSLGGFLGIWLGLFLTTPASPLPEGLPFAIAGPQFPFGWHIMYGIGAALAAIGLLLRFELPESPRWLLTQGRIAAAERVVASMEAQALKRLKQLPPPSQELATLPQASTVPYIEILGNSLYLKRTILLVVIWLIGYMTIYTIGAGLTSLLAALAYPAAEAGLISAFGTFGFILSALVAYWLGEKLERKFWLPISGIVTIIGGVTIALSGANIAIACLGSIIIFFGFNLWVPMTFAWSVENYPTRARATGFALADGVGHIGGGFGIIFISSLIPKVGSLVMFIVLGSFLLIAAGLAFCGPSTSRRRLDEVSP